MHIMIGCSIFFISHNEEKEATICQKIKQILLGEIDGCCASQLVGSNIAL